MDHNNHFPSAYTPYAQAQAQAQAHAHAQIQVQAHAQIAQQGNSQQQQQQQRQQTPNLTPQTTGQHPTVLAGFTNHAAPPPQQQQQQQQQQVLSQHNAIAHPTLPPLQSHSGNYSHFNPMQFAHANSQAPSPAPSHLSGAGTLNGHHNANASLSSHNPSVFPQHVSPINSATGTMLPPAYPPNTFATSQSAMYSAASSATPLPAVSAASSLPTLRPMPTGGVNGVIAHGLPTLPGANQLGALGQQPSFMQNEEAPTHVVGSQGRRGILPSAPGRPNPPAQGSAQATKSLVPQKDADGKFPCPHCNKTYLHAKHLKRHLLRRKSPARPIFGLELLLIVRLRYWRPTIHVSSL
jgi:hypothetical protein